MTTPPTQTIVTTKIIGIQGPVGPQGSAGDVTGGVTSVNSLIGAVTLTAENLAEGATHKFMTPAERTKLSGIAMSATANDTDANLKNRANHTGTQAIATITDLQTALDGFITSVNGQTGSSITLTADSFSDGSTNKFMTAAERTKLASVEANATANLDDTVLVARANHTGTQAASTISDFAEAVDDRVAQLLVAGTNVELSYNDVGGALTVSINAIGGSGAVDSINGQTGNVVLDADDLDEGATHKFMTADERTKLAGTATSATANDTDANLKNRANHTGTQAMSTITGLPAALSTQVIHPNLFMFSGYTQPASLGQDSPAEDGSTAVWRRVQFDKYPTNVVRTGFHVRPPANWDASQPIEVKLRIFKTITGTGTKARFLLKAISLGVGDVTNATFSSEPVAIDFSPATTRQVYEGTAVLTVDNAPAAGDLIYVEIARDATTANAAYDDFSDRISLVSASVTYALS